jgi:pimeloyl-ACP methyl ester carboxylesterase
MRRALKVIGVVVVAIIAIAVVLLAGALGYRAYRQRENAIDARILTPRGIQEAQFVDIGDLPQWIQIRGEDKANPVLLFVHGGPAMSMIPFTYRSMLPWEKSFTVVQWDQRGAGRTYLRNGGADSTSTGMDQIIDDGVHVAEYVRSRLGADKIIVMGESWGSAIALEMVRARPDLFYAYVGTGQAIDMRRAEALTYQLMLERAEAAHDDADVRQLQSVGAPPYATAEASTVEQQVLGRELAKSENAGAMGADLLFAPGYSLRETFGVMAGATQHRAKLVADDEQYDALARGTKFDVPLFFFEGSDDIQAPAQLVEEFLKQIDAPRKDLVMFPGGGHNAFYYFSTRFLQELNTRVRPLAIAARSRVV